MGLSSAGIGSNLDVDGIVSKLMSVERQPLTKLARTEASYQTKLSGFGTLKGALSAFQTAVRGLSDISKFQGLKAAAGDPAVATVSANATATPGTYALKVTQLAQSQKLVAAGMASEIAPVGKGVISFDFGSVTGGTLNAVTGKYDGSTFTSGGTGIKTVTIDATNDSLAGIRDAINKAGMGVSATIVNDGTGTPYRLALTSTATGAATSMKISVADVNAPPGDGLAQLLNHDPGTANQALSQKSAAQNAEFTVDGIAVSKPTNAVTDVIGGVTLNLLKVNTDPTPVTITRDTAAVTTAVNDFVKAYNEISKNFVDATAYNASTKQAAILNGEASVRSMQGQVKAVLSNPVAGGASAFSRLSDIGVTVQKDGTLAADASKLGNAINNNFSSVAGLFASVGKSSDSLVSYKGFSSTTKPGAYALDVSKLATKGSTTGGVPAGLTITGANNTLDVMLNGISSTITLSSQTYATPAALAAEIQSKINGVTTFSAAGSAATVTDAGGVLSMTSNKYGSASNLSITGGTAQAYLGFDAPSTPAVLTGEDVAGTINGMAATGNGQVLTSSAGGDSAGLALTVAGGATGARGTINYSQGYAYQFEQLASSILGSTGSLQARTDGLSASIKGLTKTQQALTARLDIIEKRYRAQFSALDLTISKMNTTSQFLSQQLSNLSALANG